jgi:hypothetical protein
MEKLKITKGAGKMEGLGSCNSNPLNNEFCRKMSEGNTICKECYSIKSLKSYRKGCVPAWTHNGTVLSTADHSVEDMPFLNQSIFRIHSHGELINNKHCRNIFRLALRNPKTIFGFWTKRKDIVRRCGMEVPENVIMIYSNPRIDKVITRVPKGFHKVFNVVSSEDIMKVNCGARKCVECQRCYSFETESVIVEKKK